MMMQRRFMRSLVFIMAGVLQAAAQEEHTFRVETEEVRIDVLAAEGGRPVTDLKAADFEVLDNGVPQEIRYAKLQQKMPVSVTLVFDMSRSVSGSLLAHLKDAAYRLLADLKDEDRAALITFSNAVVLGSPLTRDLTRVKLALDRAQPLGNSSLIDASYAGLVLAETQSDFPFLIIFSDGLDTFSWLTGKSVLETAKRNDAVVYAVSACRLPDETFLRDLTQLSGGSLFEVEATEDLAAMFLKILDEFRRRYLVSYTPQGVSESGWHKLDVSVKRRGVKVRARPGYMRKSPAERTK
jgi:Ca-activated chloride channel family protein